MTIKPHDLHSPEGRHPARWLRLTPVALTPVALRLTPVALLLGLLLPAVAAAVPVLYNFESGSAVITATLAGGSESVFSGNPDVAVDLTGTSVVYDGEAGANGRIESLNIASSDLVFDLDETRVALDSLSALSPTLSSLGGADVNAFNQFALDTVVSAVVEGSFPDGSTFGPVPIQSIDDTGTSTGLVQVSGDTILIQLTGVTLASFPQIANPDPIAPNVELKADFTFVGRVATPIPEPGAAALFGLGILLSGAATRRR